MSSQDDSSSLFPNTAQGNSRNNTGKTLPFHYSHILHQLIWHHTAVLKRFCLFACLGEWGGGRLQTTQLSFLLHRFVVFWRHFLSPLNTGKFGQISASRQSSPRSCVTVGWPWHTKLQEAKCFDTTLAVQECVCAGIKWKTTPWSSMGLLPNSFISH